MCIELSFDDKSLKILIIHTLHFFRLIEIEQEWVPHAESSSLYIRPTLIGTEPTLGVGAANEVLLFVILSPVGPYFASGLKPVNLVADPKFVRAWPGGCGYAKMGSNYAPTMWTQVIATFYYDVLHYSSVTGRLCQYILIFYKITENGRG